MSLRTYVQLKPWCYSPLRQIPQEPWSAKLTSSRVGLAVEFFGFPQTPVEPSRPHPNEPAAFEYSPRSLYRAPGGTRQSGGFPKLVPENPKWIRPSPFAEPRNVSGDDSAFGVEVILEVSVGRRRMGSGAKEAKPKEEGGGPGRSASIFPFRGCPASLTEGG
jgi:hypothetical protein